MLSDVDLRKHLGKGIGIYPFYPDNIEGASIYLTASDLAWSLNDGTKISNDGKIIINEKDTAIILTKESIWLSADFAGTCHSRVSISAHGIGHIGTPMKPGWTGRLLISVHNYSNERFELNIGDPIVVLMFYKLNSKAKILDHKPNARTELLSELEIKLSKDEISQLNLKENIDAGEMVYKMKESTAYKDYMKKYKSPTNKFNMYTSILLIVLLIQLYLLFINPSQNKNDILRISIPLTGVLLAPFLTLIIKDLRE